MNGQYERSNNMNGYHQYTIPYSKNEKLKFVIQNLLKN